MSRNIDVSIVYGLRDQQWLQQLSVPRGTSAYELIKLSGFMDSIDDLKDQELTLLSIGVFAQKIDGDYLLQEGDRVEIYRPLTADPKEVRRQLALLGKTMGKTTAKTAGKDKS